MGNGIPGCSNLNKSDKVPTVRFENETSSSSGDSAEPRQRFNGGKSDNNGLKVPSKKSNRGNILMEESFIGKFR